MNNLKILCRAGCHAWKSTNIGLPLGQESAIFIQKNFFDVKTLTIAQVRYVTTNKEVEEKLKEYREGKYDNLPDPEHLAHFRTRKPDVKQVDDVEKPPPGTYTLPHPIWSESQLKEVTITHKEPESGIDKWAFKSVQAMRSGFDALSQFNTGQRNENKWLNRICFLETVAGVPGMVAAMARHMGSLRRMQRDYGWIHTLLEEAENERMHLMVALQLKKPSLPFRLAVIGAQGAFVTMFSLAYIVSPKFCHRFVGYLEEEAVKTYTKLLEDMEMGPMKHWNEQKAPELAITYWKLKNDATMKDVILAIRADEAHHRTVNHVLAAMKKDDFNPFKPGQ